MAAFRNSAPRRGEARLPHPVDHVGQIGAAGAESVGGVGFILVAERDAADDLAIVGNAEMIVQQSALRGDGRLRDRAEAQERLRAQLQADQASAENTRALAEYTDKIIRKIRPNVALPPGIQGNPEATFDVTQLPSGEVLAVKLKKSSGNAGLDAAIERAILKSSPLPKPDDPALFSRQLDIKYKPYEE